MTLISNIKRNCSVVFLVIATTFVGSFAVAQDVYDIVLASGRVMDPETGLDGVRNVGIRGGEHCCDLGGAA